jgi:HK97 family phage major capsid protein
MKRNIFALAVVCLCAMIAFPAPAFAAGLAHVGAHAGGFDLSHVGTLLAMAAAAAPSYADQIAAFTADRGVKADRQKAIMDEAAGKGETLDAEQQEEFDTLQGEVEAIDKHLARLKIVEVDAGSKAVAVVGSTSDEGSASREGKVVVKTQPKLEPGIEFARLVKSLGMAKGDMGRAVRIASARYGDDSNAVGTLKAIDERGSDRLEFAGFEAIQKASVVAGSAVSGTWAADLVLTEGGAFADFANFLRPETILGKFGTGNIPGLRQVPFDTALGISTIAGGGGWVGEGLPKPLTAFNVDKTTLAPLKCANIVVLTEDLLRRESYSAETLVRDEMQGALVQLIDSAFIDPTNAGTANVKPASIANGAPHSAATGTGDADDVRKDLRSLINEFIAANSQGGPIVLIMSATDALGAGMMVNALGQPEFPSISMGGGSLFPGLSVLTSQSVPAGDVIAVQPQEIFLADDGGFMIDVSREASLQMLDNPTNDVVTPTATSLVSLWQTNSVGFRCERVLNWKKRRTTAVAYLTGVAWGGAVNDLS